ncbi:MAG: winged helix-turn-helix transcriptional regulator [Candidatus Kariarchaeaceae archaeon]
MDQESKIIDECSIASTIKMLGKKWIMYILSELMITHELSFSDLKSRIIGNYNEEISARVLSDSLSYLETDDIVIRREMKQYRPTRVFYSLTPKGRDLVIVFGVLKAWALKWHDIRYKKCRSFTCIHNAIGVLNLEQLDELFKLDLL